MAFFVPLLTPFLNLLTELLHQALLFVASVSIFFAVLHRLGVLQRAIHRLAERQLSVLLLNRAPVTVSKISVDFLTGKVYATDGIIHSPDRDKWKWDSPLIARFGKVYVHCSIWSLLDPIAQILGYQWRDFHEVVVEDVQVFVEKRHNVYNFHLLDESLDIPDPAVIMADVLDSGAADESSSSVTAATGTTSKGGGGGGELSPGSSSYRSPSRSKQRLEMIVSGDASEASLSPSSATTASSRSSGELSPSSGEDSSSEDEYGFVASAAEGTAASAFGTVSTDPAEQKANEIVTSMLKTVSTLGKAANEGGKEGFERAFKNQRDGFVSKLKRFQENVEKRNNEQAHAAAALTASPNDPDGLLRGNMAMVPGATTTKSRTAERKSSMEIMALEGMKVMKQMGKAVEKNVAEIQQSLKPPEKKKGYVSKDDDLLRFGYMVFRDVRIFTKEIILSSKTVGATRGSHHASNSKRRKRHQSGTASNPWSKPILLKEVAFGAMELASPTSVRDEFGVPMMGIKADKLIDIMVKRAFAEMAKTNTGRLLNNAFGEVLNWMDGKGNSAAKP